MCCSQQVFDAIMNFKKDEMKTLLEKLKIKLGAEDKVSKVKNRIEKNIVFSTVSIYNKTTKKQ